MAGYTLDWGHSPVPLNCSKLVCCICGWFGWLSRPDSATRSGNITRKKTKTLFTVSYLHLHWALSRKLYSQLFNSGHIWTKSAASVSLKHSELCLHWQILLSLDLVVEAVKASYSTNSDYVGDKHVRMCRLVIHLKENQCLNEHEKFSTSHSFPSPPVIQHELLCIYIVSNCMN